MSFERRRLRVYVAGPITSGVYEGVARGLTWGRTMFLDGLAPFVPHFDAFWFLPDGNWNAYLEFDLEFVSVCDAVFRLDGDSKGADLEVRIARELGLPIFYEKPPLPNDKGYEELRKFAAHRGLNGKRV